MPAIRSCLALVVLYAATPAAGKVDFGYAFAPPHRITVARPGASEKTLLDLEPGSLTLSWTYDDLRSTPLGIWKEPRTGWRIRIQPALDGKPFTSSRWSRGGGYLPMLENLYEDPAAVLRLEAIGASGAALIRVTAANRDTRPHRIAIPAEVHRGWVAHNPSWAEPGVDPDTLVAGQQERADRILLLAAGGPVTPGRLSTALEWNLAPGETASGWFVRPYKAYQGELPALRKQDWSLRFAAAEKEWRELIAGAARFDIPDAAVRNALYACLADLFIMREPLAHGYAGVTPGTELYRSTNSFEPVAAAIAVDQLGLHPEAADGLRVHIDLQGADGNWNDPTGWDHHCWGVTGFKAWAAMEHYRLTGDRQFLESVYPHLAASSRWQESRRRTTRVPDPEGSRPPTYGLMPRGMGDGGLMNGTDYFGVFYTHNILAVYADKLAAEAAGILGRDADRAELDRIYRTAASDLRTSLAKGAIEEDGFRWIPGTPNKTSGSRWGALYALFPTGLLAADDPLITGTIRKMEQSLSPGGQPINTGWMRDGVWVAITLENLAEAHLVRDEADPAMAYLYSALNHATPLLTWCEERGQEPGTKKIAGDRQHLWTPLAVVRFLRDSLVMEQGADLHLARATARGWLEDGKAVSVSRASTHFGDVSYSIRSLAGSGVVRATVQPPSRVRPAAIVLHLRHPARARITSVTVDGKPWSDFDAAREIVRLPGAGSAVTVEARYPPAR